MPGKHHRAKPAGWAGRRGEWLQSAENRVLVRQLWDLGMPTGAIAQTIGMGCTANAVIGHAHRHDFPPRLSPIRYPGAPPNEIRPRKPPGPTHGKVLAMARKSPRPSEALEAPYAPPPRPPPPVRTCQWIEAPDRPWGELCGRPCCLHPRSKTSTAWCKEHYRRVYTRHGGDHLAEAAD